jgi:hypothetical protein
MSFNSPILITGCQRSGTTLLRLILDSHPEIRSIPEVQYQDEQLNEYLSDPQYHPYVLFKLPTFAHAVSAIKSVPKLKVLWCIRDPRDVVASMLNLRLQLDGASISWAAHPHGADREIQNCASALQARTKSELEKIMHRYIQIGRLPPSQRSHIAKVYVGALCWRLKQELLAIYDLEKIDYKLVTYTKLIANPKHEIGEILSYLGVPWDDNVLKHDQLHHGKVVGNTDSERPIDGGNTGKWKKSLKSDDLKIIHSICSEMAKKYGYKL